jgi:Domain of unknown function (DUF4350)
MPVGIAASDRKLLLIGGALLVLLSTASVILAPPGEQFDSPVPSTYSAQSHGAEAAYLLLSHLSYHVRRWEDPPTEFDGDPEDTLLILAEPGSPPSAKERNALQQFVTDGGHVLFTGSNISMYFPDADVSFLPPDPDWKSFSPSMPNRFARGAQHVTMQPKTYWGRLSPSQLALYGDRESPVVVSWSVGDGEILWWAGSTPLTNAGIAKEDNLAFFLNCVGNWSSNRLHNIYWDEYFHGQRSSLWSYVGKTSLAWSVLQVGLLALAILFTFSRRSGPIYVPANVSRLSPLEFVDTLGGLYERAGAAGSAVRVSYLRLRSLLARQLSLPTNTPDAELALAAEQRLGWKDSGLGDLLRRAEVSGTAVKLPRREALELVQKLEGHAEKLNVRNQYRREKT